MKPGVIIWAFLESLLVIGSLSLYSLTQPKLDSFTDFEICFLVCFAAFKMCAV